MRRRSFIGGVIAASATLPVLPSWAQGDPLPSWNDGAAKQSIVDFVTRITTPGSRDWIVPPERIATFDNDGAPSAFQAALHRSRLSADARAAGFSARQPIQDVYRLGRRHRVHTQGSGSSFFEMNMLQHGPLLGGANDP